MNATPVALACANCFWHQNKREGGIGDCWRHPPQVIVLFGPKADLQRAQNGLVQQPTGARPTMQPHEFCGEFTAAPEAMPMQITPDQVAGGAH